MKKIAPIIIEDGTSELPINKKRTTIRGIILNEFNEVLLVYSFKLNDYTFPGGGLKANEDHIEGLKRELKEELGAKQVVNIVPFGYIEEKRYGVNNSSQNIYLQTSYYYFCNVLEFGSQELVEREKEFGVEPKWIDIDKAITHNEKLIRNQLTHKGMTTVLPREIIILKSIKEYLNNESI